MLAQRTGTPVPGANKHQVKLLCVLAQRKLVHLPQRQVACGASSSAGDSFQKARDAATAAANAAAAEVRYRVQGLQVPDMATLDVDIKKMVNWNFLVQLGLTAVSWAITFFTSHANIAKGAAVDPTTALLMVGVLLSGYSAYLSYTYLLKVKGEGLNVLQGWQQMKLFYEHLTVNFVGAAATVLALQAEVGTLVTKAMSKKAGGMAVEALAQASANTLLAHLVSIVFLTFMIRKVTAAYQRLLEWGENLSKSMPRL